MPQPDRLLRRSSRPPPSCQAWPAPSCLRSPYQGGVRAGLRQVRLLERVLQADASVDATADGVAQQHPGCFAVSMLKARNRQVVPIEDRVNRFDHSHGVALGDFYESRVPRWPDCWCPLGLRPREVLPRTHPRRLRPWSVAGSRSGISNLLTPLLPHGPSPSEVEVPRSSVRTQRRTSSSTSPEGGMEQSSRRSCERHRARESTLTRPR